MHVYPSATLTQVRLCCLFYQNLNLNEFYQNVLFITPAAVTQKKAKSAEAVTETWKKQKKDAKNNVRMPPQREWAGREEPRGGDPEEEEVEEEELAKTGQTSHLSRSHQSGFVD